MKRIILVFGSVIGIMLCANMLVMVSMMYQGTFKANDFVGYTSLVVMFSLIFFGVRNYRNKQPDDAFSFGHAFKAGALIALVASTIYVMVWLFYYHLFVPDFIEVYTNYVVENCPVDSVQAKTVQMANFKEMYKNPLFIILITYAEVLPIGMAVALVSALILRKKTEG